MAAGQLCVPWGMLCVYNNTKSGLCAVGRGTVCCWVLLVSQEESSWRQWVVQPVPFQWVVVFDTCILVAPWACGYLCALTEEVFQDSGWWISCAACFSGSRPLPALHTQRFTQRKIWQDHTINHTEMERVRVQEREGRKLNLLARLMANTSKLWLSPACTKIGTFETNKSWCESTVYSWVLLQSCHVALQTQSWEKASLIGMKQNTVGFALLCL